MAPAPSDFINAHIGAFVDEALPISHPPMCEVRYKTRIGVSDRFNKRRFSSTGIIRFLFSSSNTKS